MTSISFFLILAGVLLNACAQLLLKAGVNAIGRFSFSIENVLPVGFQLATQPPIIAGLACYVVSVVVWILGLSRVDVSIAYPMLSLGEVVTLQRAIGIGVILLGVYLVARSTTT
jgi:multidrug transporter EmrE-like cation transporter